MEKLNKILELTKCSVIIEVNRHKNYYQTAYDYINENKDIRDDVEEDFELLNKMVELDNIVMIQCYLDTPIGSYTIYHYDLELALDEMISVLEDNKKEWNESNK